MTYEFYTLRVFHKELGFIRECYSTFEDAIDAVGFYIHSCTHLSLFGENSKSQGKLLICYREPEVQ